MKYLALVAAVCLLMVPSVALAQQISPNPNPSGNTITVDTKYGDSSGDFDNYGTIDIKGNGTLWNDGTLRNEGAVINSGTGETPREMGLINHLRLINYGTLNNNGDMLNTRGGIMWNYGKVTNDGTFRNEGFVNMDTTWDNYGTLINTDLEYIYSTAFIVYGTGTLSNYYGGTLPNDGELSNYGRLNNHGTLTFESGSELSQRDLNTGETGTLTNASGGRIESYVDDFYIALTDSSDAIFVGGTVNLESGSTFANYANINITSALKMQRD